MAQPRVLILDDEPEVADILAASLPRTEFEVEVTHRPSEALARAANGRFDIALFDVGLPEMNGFEARDRLRALPGLEGLPVLFVTGAMSPMDASAAKRLQTTDRILIKPVPRVELRRNVYTALGMVTVEEGAIGAALDGILFRISDDALTGVLTATRANETRRVIVHNGNIVFVASSDPRCVVSQAVVRSGLLGEKDVLDAFASEADPARMKAVLGALRKVAPEQSQRLFEPKIRESVLALFLWDDAKVRFVGSGVEDADMPFPISLPIQPIRAEGAKRRRRWSEVRDLLPAATAGFEKIGAWPQGFPRSGGDELLAQALERGETLGRILDQFRGQEYAISVRIADLVRRGTIRTSAPRAAEPTPLPEPPEPVSEMASGEFARAPLAKMMEARSLTPPKPIAAVEPQQPPEPAPAAAADGPIPGDPPPREESSPKIPPEQIEDPFERAVALLRDRRAVEAHGLLANLAAGDPHNPMIQTRIVEAESEIEAAARSVGLRDEAKLKLAIPINQLMGKKNLAPQEAFLLSRFAAGAMQVGSIIVACPVPPFQVLQTLQKFLEDGTLKKAD